MAAGKPAAPVRMAFLYVPNGANMRAWVPEGTGRDYKLSKTLEPLKDLKDDVLVLSNLWNEASKAGDGHYVKESAILTCSTIKKTPGADLANGISVDQLAAQRVGKQTPLPSLELGITPTASGIDAAVGYTRLYGSHIAWSSPTTPLAREINPHSAYERLFRASGQRGSAGPMDRLLLDRVLGEANRMRAQLGAADRLRVDEYLSGMRSLEERLDRANSPQRNPWKPRVALDTKAQPEDREYGHADHVRLMLDVIALAFQSDTTRISTFMFGNAVSEVSFRFLEGVSAGHHDVSHHQKDEDKLRQYEIISRWHVQQFGYLLSKLRSMKEGDSNVLANSMILFGSALSDGDAHDPHKLPILLGGRGGGRIASGQHLIYPVDSPLSNLYVSMLDAFGTPVPRFADSTGQLAGVLA
ncbi:MAG: DUF1552 domain-containing protein [Bryobacteraceae bacterium]|nr:DUF1552 domain-containing protein [Bryobacteraceae bacterium]